jgi:uncharacterized membrane protein
MAPMILRVSWLMVLLAIAISAAAQAATPATQAPNSQTSSPAQSNAAPPKPPDMVCFGYGPNWSIQFINGEARYLGINQPDQYFLGDFYWIPNEKVWNWHRANGLAPMNGSFGLSATVQNQSCKDPVRKETYPYSAQVNLPQGDMVSGCCRRLRAGEAPVGKHGVAPQPGALQPSPTQPATPQPQ